jgi:translation initiation factor 2B subunit (eIF-2B alpha/beta/delta family)
MLRLCYDNVNATGLFNDALKIWRAKPDAAKTYAAFKTVMTVEHEDRMKNDLTSKAAGYSANQTTFVTDLVHQELQQFVNHMPYYQQAPPNDENRDPNPNPAPTDVTAALAAHDKANAALAAQTANAALTTDALKEIFQTMMKEHKRSNPSKVKPKAQGKDDNDKEITYCHSHGITSNLWHNSTTCSRKKEGHKEASCDSHQQNGRQH